MGEKNALFSRCPYEAWDDKRNKSRLFAWNQHRHLEAYFAVPCSGAILHMVNIRLSEEHLIYIINHAEDEILMVDVDLLPIIENIAPKLKTVKHYIIMTDEPALPKTTLQNFYPMRTY